MVAETEATEPIHSVPLQLLGAAALPINPADNIVDVDAEAGDLHRLDPITFEEIFVAPPTKIDIPESARAEYGRLGTRLLRRSWTADTENRQVHERRFKERV